MVCTQVLPFTYFPSDCLVDLGPLPFYMHITTSVSIFIKQKKPVGIYIPISLTL